MAVDMIAWALAAQAQADIDTFKNQQIYTFKGSVLYAGLPANPDSGDTWNILNSFTLDGITYQAGTNLAWNGTSWNPLGFSVVQMEGIIYLLTAGDTSPAVCAINDKYYNTTTKLIYEATATNTWGTIGATPSNISPYLALDTDIIYYWNGTDMIPSVPFNGVLYGEVEANGTNLIDKLDNHIDPITKAEAVTYNGTNSGLDATNVKDAIDEIIEDTADLINDYVGKKIQIDLEGTVSAGVITFEPATPYIFSNNTEYEFDLLLPVAGTLSDNWTMQINNNGQTIKIINSYNNGGGNTATVGTMKQLQQYNVETGFRWIFDGTINVADGNITIFITPTVVNLDGIEEQLDVINNTLDEMLARDIIQINNEEMLDALDNGGYADGQLVICEDDNGYVLGHVYKFTVTGGPTYDWIDITPFSDVTPSTPSRSIIYVEDLTNYIIENSGIYDFGTVNSLNISTTEPVYIKVNGIVNSLAFPTSTKTVNIQAPFYSGSENYSTRPEAIADGSVIGKYQFGAIDAQ